MSAAAGAGGGAGAAAGGGTTPAVPLPSAVPQPHFLEDCASWSIPGTSWSLYGHSQAGERTGFYIPETKLCLDAGMNSYRTIDHVLLTHAHADHAFTLTHLYKYDAPDPAVFCPAAMVEPVKAYARAAQALNDCRAEPVAAMGTRYVGVRAGDAFDLRPRTKPGGKPRGGAVVAGVTVVDCVHTVPSVGFMLHTVTNKLKAEFAELPGREIAALRKAGTEVTHVVRTPRLAFLGDTTAAVFDVSPAVLTCPVVVVECTMVGRDADSVASAEDRGHVSWLALAPVVAAHPHVTFVLIHFSRRYSDADVVREFMALDGGFPDNVVLWLDSGPWGPRAGPSAKPAATAPRGG